MSVETTEHSSGDDGAGQRTPAQPDSKKIALSAAALGVVALLIYGTYITAVVLRTGG
ncbi:MAG: hypothetical protein AAGA68_04210 [Pseudomonadota bacterium]